MLLCREMPTAFPMKSPSTCSTTASNTTRQGLQRSTLPTTYLPTCHPQSAPPRHFIPHSVPLRRLMLNICARPRRARARQVRVSGFGIGCFLHASAFGPAVRAHVHMRACAYVHVQKFTEWRLSSHSGEYVAGFSADRNVVEISPRSRQKNKNTMHPGCHPVNVYDAYQNDPALQPGFKVRLFQRVYITTRTDRASSILTSSDLSAPAPTYRPLFESWETSSNTEWNLGKKQQTLKTSKTGKT
jgi:hypothetical protein